MIKIPLLALTQLLEPSEYIESWSIGKELFIGALLLRSDYGFHIVYLIDLLALLKVTDFYIKELKGIGSLNIASFNKEYILIEDSYFSFSSIPLKTIDGWFKNYLYLSYMKSFINCYIKEVELKSFLRTSYRYKYKVEKPEALIEERIRKVEIKIRELEGSHPLMKGII